MNAQESVAAASLICSVYPNTAGRADVIDAYSTQLLPFPYEFTVRALIDLPGKHDTAFCPSIQEIHAALVSQFQTDFAAAVDVLAWEVYPTRYLEGDDEHRAHFVEWYRQRVGPPPGRDILLHALRSNVTAAELLARLHRPLPPREGGPIPPPERKDRDGRVCAAVRFGDWNGLLLAAAGER